MNQKLEIFIEDLKKYQSRLQKQYGYHLEFSINTDEKEAVLSGNQGGILHFFCRILSLIEKEKGSHIHFDENADFPEGSNKLTILRDVD